MTPREHPRRERDPYQTVAPWYDRLIEPLNVKLKDIALATCPAGRGDAVLDVGCGTGTLLERYLARGCEVWGLDGSPAMLKVARGRLGSQAGLVLGDGGLMPFADDSFDVVTVTMMLHELRPRTRTAVLNDMARVVRPSGRILLVDYCAGPLKPSPRAYLLRGLITSIEAFAGGEHFAGFRHFMKHGGVSALARSHSLREESCRIVGGGNLALCVLRRENRDDS